MKHLLNYSCRCLLSLMAMIAVSLSASAQDATIVTANGTSNGGATISGSSGYVGPGYGYLVSAQESVTISATKTIVKIVLTESDWRSYGNWNVDPAGQTSYSRPQFTWEGKATSVTFTNPSTDKFMGYYGIDKIEVWYEGGTVDPGTGGGTVDPGTGGGTVDPDPDPTPGTQPLSVTVDFTKFSKGIASPISGIICESDGQYNSVYGWQVQEGKHVTFAAPYGYLISQIVINDVTGQNAYYFNEIDGNTWTGSASSVTLTSNYYSHITTAAITLVKDPSAKNVFDPFTSASPASGSTVQSLSAITLALPAGLAVDRATTGSAVISVNGKDASVSTSTTTGAQLVITLDNPIVADGTYEIVIPQEIICSGNGEASPKTTLTYTVVSPYFELTADNFSPKPGDEITISLDPNNLQVFKAINIRYPDGLTLQGGSVAFSIDGKRITAPLNDYGTSGVLNFESNSITSNGQHTFVFPQGAFTTTSGKQSTALTLVYNVGVKYSHYTINLSAGSDALPADATITVAGQTYKNRETVSSTTPITEADVNATIDGYILKSLNVVPPTIVTDPNTKEQTTYNGAINATYEKIVPRVSYASVSPAGTVNLDNTTFETFTIIFPQDIEQTINYVPRGYRFTNPNGSSVSLAPVEPFYGQGGGRQLKVTFEAQNVLGKYTFELPADVITFKNGQKNEAIKIEWTLTGTKFQFDGYSANPIKEFAGFVLAAPSGISFQSCSATTLQAQVGTQTTTIPVSTTVEAGRLTFVFSQPFQAEGSVKLTIPAGSVIAKDGRKNVAFTLTQYVNPILRWDASGDNAVDATDVRAAVNSALRSASNYIRNDEAFQLIDVNHDGQITIGEVAKLILQLQTLKQ